MRILIFIILLNIFYINYGFAQGTAGEKAMYESRYIVDMPTAGIIEKGAFAIYSTAFANGGILLELEAAPFTDFNMGISYAGNNIIGSGEVVWQNIPGIHLCYRLFNESKSLPAFVLGINTQGRGSYSSNDERFETYSPGVFLSASKNYRWFLGTVAFHAGTNYSIEPNPPERSPNFYCGLEHSIGSYFSLNFEYNATFDDGDHSYLKQKGLINTAFRWSLSKGITLELQARDLLEHQAGKRGFSRVICLEYINSF